jgi:hypothetical protein
MDPLIFERGDSVFIVAKVSPFEPSNDSIDEFAFADQLKKMAPSEHIMWLCGQYVEADTPNANGQMWSGNELAIKAMTPNFMPVTVMHDPRTAVGLIADTKLLVPDRDAVARARIDTKLALWKHRFPEIAEECMVNYERGDLMQSMECKSPWYECAECAQVFQKLPPFDEAGIGKERANWCDHLNANGRRILGNVVFTGTGLIFGTRGARGANDKAHLEVFQEEVAEYHEKTHRDTRKTTKPKPARSKTKMEIEDRRYEELLAAEQTAKRVPDLEQKLSDAEEAKVTAEKKVETTEADKVKAEEEAADLKKKVEEADESARKRDLAGERLGKLGTAFKDKINKIESVKSRLDEQAANLSDEDWQARVEELAELTGVKADAARKKGEQAEDDAEGEGDEGAEEFSAEEIAASQATAPANGGGGAKSREVVAGLFAQTAPGGGKKSE